MSNLKTDICSCGAEKPKQLLQCKGCRAAAIKKIAKYSVLAGIILGLICQYLPEGYQATCKTVAGALAAC